MDAKTILAIIFVLAAIATVLSMDSDAFNAILKGHRNFSDPEAGQFKVPKAFFVGLMAVVFLSFFALVGVKAVLGHLAAEFSESEYVALRQLEAKRSAVAAELEREKERKLLERFNTLEESISDLRTVGLPDGRRVYYGISDRNLGNIHTRTTEVRVDNGEVYDEYVVVVHLLQGVAYWEIGSPNYFVDDNDNDVRLLDQLRSADVRNELVKFEYVAGVGLESRTAADTPGLSKERANTLCTAIYNSVKDTRKTTALGMSIGKYQGEFQETSISRENRQRSVIIVGIRTLHHSVDYRAVIKKILNAVEISGLELSSYEGFKLGGQIEWTTMTDCNGTPGFLEPRAN